MLCIWLYGWGMSQKLPVNDFKWVEDLPDFDEVFTKNYNEKCKKRYFFEVYIQYPKESYKNEHVIHIRKTKQVLNHWLVSKKKFIAIKFNQKAWLKLYIKTNTDLRKKTKNSFEQQFFKLISNSVFGDAIENSRNHREIKLEKTTKKEGIWR